MASVVVATLFLPNEAWVDNDPRKLEHLNRILAIHSELTLSMLMVAEIGLTQPQALGILLELWDKNLATGSLITYHKLRELPILMSPFQEGFPKLPIVFRNDDTDEEVEIDTYDVLFFRLQFSTGSNLVRFIFRDK